MNDGQTNADKIMDELRSLVLDRLDDFNNRLKNIEKSIKPSDPVFKCTSCEQEGIKLSYQFCPGCGGKFSWVKEQDNKKVK